MRKRAHHTYQCPLCHHGLTADEYERVLGIQEAKERELRAMRDEVKQLKKTLLADFQKKVARAKLDARRSEQQKSAATIKRLSDNLKKAQIENEHLKNGTTQAEVGRAWDGQMADFIKSVFGPLGDHVEATKGSRKGDVIVNIRHNGEVVCPVIIENKTGLTITPEFIRQASNAKRERKARYALLVSDGKRRGFEGGIKRESDVLLVKPAALISLLHVIRDVHVELARTKATVAQIDNVSANLLTYVTGQEFRTPLESVLKAATDLQTHLAKEQNQTQRWWSARSAFYRQICVDAETIRSGVNAILENGRRSVVPFRRAS